MYIGSIPLKGFEIFSFSFSIFGTIYVMVFTCLGPRTMKMVCCIFFGLIRGGQKVSTVKMHDMALLGHALK